MLSFDNIIPITFFILPLLIILIFTITLFVKNASLYTIADNTLAFFLTIIIPIITTISNYHIYSTNPKIGFFFYVILLISLSIYTIDEKYRFTQNLKIRDFPIFRIIVIILPTVLLTISLFIQILRNEVSVEHQLKLIDINSIEESFENIKEKYISIENTISEETKYIDTLMDNALKTIDITNKELEELQKREKSLIAQIEYLRNLASISEEQTSALLIALKQDKYKDYLIGGIIGFFVGFLSNFLFAIIFKPSSNYLNPK